MLEKTVFVSDAFHIVNHTCADSFHPSSYPALNCINSVSHEQRNKSIAELKGSLRQCSRDTYIIVLSYHAAVLKLIAIARKTHRMQGNTTQFGAANLGEFHGSYIGCTCSRTK